MAVVTSHVYPAAITAINSKTINLTADTFKAGLCTASAATWGGTQEAYQFVSSVTAAYTEVATGGGYTSGYAGRLTLAAPALSTSGNVVKWTVTSPINFGATTTISAASMFIYDNSIGAADASAPLICIVDFGQTVVSTAGAFTYTLDAVNGLASWTEN